MMELTGLAYFFMKIRLRLLAFITCFTSSTYAQQTALPVQQDRWKILPDGSIEWTVDSRLPHTDHLEMSGEKVSLWVQYGVNEHGQSTLEPYNGISHFPVATGAYHCQYDVQRYRWRTAQVPDQ